MQILLAQLSKILKLIKMRPASGYGFTTIEWKRGEIYEITKKETFRPEDIN